jgi:hypothetical protein
LFVLVAVVVLILCGPLFKWVAAELMGLAALPLSAAVSPGDGAGVPLGEQAGRLHRLVELQPRSSQSRPTTVPSEARDLLRPLIDPGGWPPDSATVGASVDRTRARLSATGTDPVMQAYESQLPSWVAGALRRCRFNRIDPGLAAFWAQQAVVPMRARQLHQLGQYLTGLGESWLAAGRQPEAALAYGAAIAAMTQCAASSHYGTLVLLAAEDLAHASRGLAGVADAQGDGLWAGRLRGAAAQWDRLYADWRRGVSGPPSMLPNTGSAVYDAPGQRAALLSLAQVGIVVAALCVYAAVLVIAGLTAAAGAVLRRPSARVCWATRRSGWPASAVFLVVPTLAAGALLRLAGDDWSWLTSADLVIAVALLVGLGHVTAVRLAARMLFRREERTRTRRADWVTAAWGLGPAFLGTIWALVLVVREPDQQRAIVPPLVEFTILLAWCWLVVFAAFLVFGGVGCVVRWLRSAVAGEAGPGAPTPLFAMAAVGFLVHAILLPPTLWMNQRAFLAHSEKAAHALADEPAARLGSEWRARYVPDAAQLLAPLRERR